ncbi:MAG: hypothetical protein J2P23_00870 [Microlunatus sp.]|nr:hypothetical protein [Microlunatus sp.]
MLIFFGVGLAYGLANALFGGTAPYIGTWFESIGHGSYFYSYVTIMIAISLVVYVAAFRNKGATHLDTEQGHAYEEEASARA